MLRVFGHPIAMCCDMLGVVGSSLKKVKFEPTALNKSQYVATGWLNACNMLRWHVAIVWPGLYAFYYLRSYFCQQRLRYSDHDSFSGYFVFLVGVGRGSRGVCGEDVAPSHLRDRSQKAGVGQMMLLD